MSPQPITTPPLSTLRKLAEVRAEPRGVLSLYVDLDPSVFPTPADRRMEIDALTDEAERMFVDEPDLAHHERNRRREEVARIREELANPDVPKGGTHTVAVFSAPAEDVFEVIRLPQPVAPAVVVDNTPYLRPITDDAGPRKWAVLLIDRKHTRILYGGPRRLLEVTSFEDNVPAHQKQGGWSQARYQRHSDNAAEEHITDTARMLFEFFERVQFDALAIAAPDPAYNEVVDALHSYLRERFAGRVHIEVAFPTPAQVLEAAQPLFAEARDGAVNELLGLLEESSRDRVTIGPRDTLQALSERRVDTLIVESDFRMLGVRCPKCGWVGMDGPSCPFDEENVEERTDVVDDAVDLALLQAARVVTVGTEAPRHPSEPMAALLRF